MGESWFKRELTGRRLVFNVIFYGGQLGLFAKGWTGQEDNPQLALLNLLKFSVWSSRGAGLVLAILGALILVPVCRNLVRVIRPKLAFLMPADENLWFHRQVAYSILFWTIVHTTAHYVNMINVERTQVRTQTAVGIMYTQPGAFTGHVMLLIMVLMYTTGHYRIRQQCFEAFWYTHHLAFFWMLGLYTHATGCFVRGAFPGLPQECLGYHSIYYTWIGGTIYFFERVWREIRARRSTEIVGVLMHPSGAMEIRFRKPSFKYVAGQWLFLQVPDVSIWQWHPFTISSAPDDPYVSVHVRQVGDWTCALGERLGATPQLAASLTNGVKKGVDGLGDARADNFIDITAVRGGGGGLPRLRIDGPYGAPAEDVFGCQVAVLVGAGIGVTPFGSILKDIYYMQQKGKLGALQRVEFIWLNKDAAAFGWFRALLQNLEDLQTNPNFLQMSMYLTSRLDKDMVENVSLNDAGAQYDPLTGLKSRTHFGRPDWRLILTGIRDGIMSRTYVPGLEASLRTKVGVFYCGPSGLAKVLKEECKRTETPDVEFGFYKEHF